MPTLYSEVVSDGKALVTLHPATGCTFIARAKTGSVWGGANIEAGCIEESARRKHL